MFPKLTVIHVIQNLFSPEDWKVGYVYIFESPLKPWPLDTSSMGRPSGTQTGFHEKISDWSRFHRIRKVP